MTDHLPFSVFPPNDSAQEIPAQSPFTLRLNPSKTGPTDIWRKPGPPLINTFNAPIFYKECTISTFKRCRVTVSGKWEGLYDQGGLVFIVNDKPAAQDSKWIKTGIEYVNSRPNISTVACHTWADWSLLPAGIHASPSDPLTQTATLEMERDPVEGTLWVYVIEGEKRTAVREVTWVLSEPGETVVWVGMYAATPTVGRGEGDLAVGFTGWELELMGEEK